MIQTNWSVPSTVHAPSTLKPAFARSGTICARHSAIHSSISAGLTVYSRSWSVNGRNRSTDVVVVDRRHVLDDPDGRSAEAGGSTPPLGALERAQARRDPISVDRRLVAAGHSRPLRVGGVNAY